MISHWYKPFTTLSLDLVIFCSTMPRTKQTAKNSTGGVVPRKSDKTEKTAPASIPAVRLVVSSDSATPLPPPPSDGKNDVCAYLLKRFSPVTDLLTVLLHLPERWTAHGLWVLSTVSLRIMCGHPCQSGCDTFHLRLPVMPWIEFYRPSLWALPCEYITYLIVTKTNERLRPSTSWMVLRTSTTPSIPPLISLRSRLPSKSPADFKCTPTPRCPMTPFWSCTLCSLGHLTLVPLLLSSHPTCQDFLPSLLSGLLRWNSILPMIQMWNCMQSGLPKFAANTSMFICTAYFAPFTYHN